MVVEEDLRQTRLLLDRFHPGRKLPFAITECNAVYTLGGSLDNNIASLGGALYVADLLRVLAARDDILMANFWSLAGNWVFGMVSHERRLRPAYHVLRACSEILRGQLLELEVRGPTFVAPAIGAVPATRGVPAIAALATAYAGRTSLLVINKSVKCTSRRDPSGPGRSDSIGPRAGRCADLRSVARGRSAALARRNSRPVEDRYPTRPSPASLESRREALGNRTVLPRVVEEHIGHGRSLPRPPGRPSCMTPLAIATRSEEAYSSEALIQG